MPNVPSPSATKAATEAFVNPSTGEVDLTLVLKAAWLIDAERDACVAVIRGRIDLSGYAREELIAAIRARSEAVP